jgi:thioredoxin 1
MMLSRRSMLFCAVAASAFALTPVLLTPALLTPALAASPQPFDEKAFAAAQKAGKPVLIDIHASWCPTCKAQAPILGELTTDPKFKDLAYFLVDFDTQKDLVRRFGARMQSTLIAFRGDKEEGRSVGDTNRASIAALLNKML